MEKTKVRYLIIDAPLVEYITIKPDKICQLDYWPNPTPTLPHFKVLLEKKELINMFEGNDIFKPEKVKNSASFIYLILYNIKLEDIKYRFHSVLLLGDSEPSSMEIYQISTKEFYWSTLKFQLYDENAEDIQTKVVKWI